MASAKIQSGSSPAKRTKVIMNHQRSSFENPSPYAVWFFPDDNCNKVFCQLRFETEKKFDNYHEEFGGGQFIMSAELPREYPAKPPKHVKFLTPNGVFAVGGSICIDGGEFHPENYKKEQGFPEFLVGQIMNVMLNYKIVGSGISHIHGQTSKAQKQKFAKESREWNKKNMRKYDKYDLYKEFEDAVPQWQEQIKIQEAKLKEELQRAREEREKEKAKKEEVNNALDDLDF